MTCIVGYLDRKNKRGWIGSDSAAVYSDSLKLVNTNTKIITINKNYKVGYCGEFQTGRLIEQMLNERVKFPLHIKNVNQANIFLRTILEFASANSIFIANNKFNTETNDASTSYVFPTFPLNFMIVSKQGIWSIEEGLTVIEITNDYYSIGSGSEEATGALYLCQHYNNLNDGYLACELALKASLAHNGSVKDPFFIEEV